MPKVPSISPATGLPTNGAFIHTTDGSFVDNAGRCLLLRGVNLSGSSKAPVGMPSYVLQGFWEGAEDGEESFIGRPFNLEDGSADVHLARLKAWGFNMIRFPVAWEALEHAGPGKYDYEFMDYTVQVLRKCKEYGFKVYMDPHQDIWSRFSGGSGAPYWTLLACGINPRNFTATQAALLHSEYPLAHCPEPANFPPMQWATNYGRLAAQTMFTLFFGGRMFAPKAIIDDQNIQDYLQNHFINAFGELADRIRDAGDLFEECVIGWDSINEPSEGLCGYENLTVNSEEQGSTLKKGTYPTPAESLKLGMGQPQIVDNWKFGSMGPRRDGTVTIDPKGLTIWADPATEVDGVHPKWGWKRSPEWKLGTCLWAQHGIWDIESGYILRPDYFRFAPDEDIDFIKDLWRPHWLAYSKRIRQSHLEAIVFLHPPVFALPPPIEEADLKGRCCYSPHYYDGLTLITRHWNWFNSDALGLIRGKYKNVLQAVRIGEKAIRQSFQEQLGMFKDDALLISAGSQTYPTIIGEIGTPFDMDGKRSYGWTDNGKHLGDYSNQQKALDASLSAADGPNALNWTIWTYCPDSSHTWGDGWNMEDLSLWSADDLRPKMIKEMNGFAVSDSSTAGLLKSKSASSFNHGTFSPDAMARRSTLSLSTLPLANGISYDENQKVDMISWENPHDFLSDGARAVQAFSRPWPTAIIGRSKNIEFNISKAEFKLTVLVRPEDAPKARDGVSLNCASTDKEVELATEIYLPLVHYAHDRYLPRCQEQDDENAKTSSEVVSSDGSRSVSTINLSNLPTHVSPGVMPSDILDISVCVSEGRWEVDGQTLKWWYPVPKEGEDDKEYTIEIRRNGGVIKSAAGESALKYWYETLCSGFCCMM